MDTLQHACNRVYAPDSSLFRNDTNNVAALQSVRVQKKLMEEAALVQEEQLKKANESLRTQIVDKEKVEEERDGLLREVKLMREKWEEETRLWKTKIEEATLTQQKRLDESNESLRAQVVDKEKIEEERNGLLGEVETMKQRLEEESLLWKTKTEDYDNKISTLQRDVSEKEAALQEARRIKCLATNPQSGTIAPTSAWNSGTKDTSEVITVQFTPQYLQPPRLLFGLVKLDQAASQRITLRSEALNITSNGFDLSTFTAWGAQSYPWRSSWLALPKNDIYFETGVSDTYGAMRFDNNQTVVNRISFARRFNIAPTVVSWFYEINMPSGWRSQKIEIQNVDETRFDLKIATWADRKFDGVRVGWLAFNDNGCRARAKCGVISVSRAERWKSEHVNFAGLAFSKPPAVFLALMEFDSGDDKNLRLYGAVKSVSLTGFDYECGTWAAEGDHNMDHANWVWIATE